MKGYIDNQPRVVITTHPEEIICNFLGYAHMLERDCREGRFHPGYEQTSSLLRNANKMANLFATTGKRKDRKVIYENGGETYLLNIASKEAHKYRTGMARALQKVKKVAEAYEEFRDELFGDLTIGWYDNGIVAGIYPNATIIVPMEDDGLHFLKVEMDESDEQRKGMNCTYHWTNRRALEKLVGNDQAVNRSAGILEYLPREKINCGGFDVRPLPSSRYDLETTLLPVMVLMHNEALRTVNPELL